MMDDALTNCIMHTPMATSSTPMKRILNEAMPWVCSHSAVALTTTAGNQDAITTSRMMDAYGVAAAPEPGTNATGYLVSHSSQVFLVDSHGKLVALYPFGTGWDALAADLERLL